MSLRTQLDTLQDIKQYPLVRQLVPVLVEEIFRVHAGPTVDATLEINRVQLDKLLTEVVAALLMDLVPILKERQGIPKGLS